MKTFIHHFLVNQNILDKFLSRVQIDSCWIWTASTDDDGYGRFWYEAKKKISAHRFSYLIYIGELEQGKVVCHKCDNPICCNPFHLFSGTNRENMIDKVNKGRVPKKYNKLTI